MNSSGLLVCQSCAALYRSGFVVVIAGHHILLIAHPSPCWYRTRRHDLSQKVFNSSSAILSTLNRI